MKCIRYKQAGDYKIILDIVDATPDPEATKIAAEPFLKKNMTPAEAEEILMKYARYSPDAIEDNIGDNIKKQLENCGDHEALTDNLEYISDYTGIEYWIKNNGKWEQDKIENINIELPAAAVLPENLTEGQKEEIAAQKETVRIANLSADDREKEKNNRIATIKREAIAKKQEADIFGDIFDAEGWKQKITAIEAKYIS
jgi:hypothetical protein